MEVKPKISRNLILVVIFIFSILTIGIYALLSSEDLTKYAINTAVTNFVPNEKVNLSFGNVEGCLLNGIKIGYIEIKHVKPNFDAKIKNLFFKPVYDNLLKRGSVQIVGSIEDIDCVGVVKLPPMIASVPAFIGTECFAGMPNNIRIKSFDINKIRILPCGNSDLEVISNNVALKSQKDSDNLDVKADIKIDWKSKPFAKTFFDGVYDQKRNKLNGNIKINAAKQVILSELSVANGKKGLEVSGYVASETIIDLLPLSQWLGGFWQLEYPYALSGKLYCQGSWLYNSSIGFLGNLNGKYEKLDISVMGLFFSLLELNGEWKLFDGNLNFNDKGSCLMGFPASLNGNIESVATPNRKWNLTFVSNSLPLDKLTSSLPWMIKYSNGIPDLMGIATLSVNLLGNKPVTNAKVELENLAQVSNSTSKISGKALYIISETGSGTINANFEVLANNGLPPFFKRFNNGFYDIENNNKTKNSYVYSVNGSLNDKVILKGKVKLGESKTFETNGELVDNRFKIGIVSNENRVYRYNSADPIDLLLMR